MIKIFTFLHYRLQYFFHCYFPTNNHMTCTPHVQSHGIYPHGMHPWSLFIWIINWRGLHLCHIWTIQPLSQHVKVYITFIIFLQISFYCVFPVKREAKILSPGGSLKFWGLEGIKNFRTWGLPFFLEGEGLFCWGGGVSTLLHACQEQSFNVIALLLLEKRTRKFFHNSELWMGIFKINSSSVS